MMTWREKMAAGIELTEADVAQSREDVADEIIDRILASRAVDEGRASPLIGVRALESARTTSPGANDEEV